MDHSPARWWVGALRSRSIIMGDGIGALLRGGTEEAEEDFSVLYAFHAQ